MTEPERRVELQLKLEAILGSKNVYFQPPETMKLNYPCIIYFKNAPLARYANDAIYKRKQSYTVTVVDKNPDSELGYMISDSFQYCKIDSNYKSDNLNHTKLTLYY